MDEGLGQGQVLLRTMQASVMSDLVSVLRHIVGPDTLEQCPLVDGSDQIVSSLTNSPITTTDEFLTYLLDIAYGNFSGPTGVIQPPKTRELN